MNKLESEAVMTETEQRDLFEDVELATPSNTEVGTKDVIENSC